MSFYRYSRLERTGWRDESISRRHREWGFNCPAVDIDFLMVEYNEGIPVAIIEYKRYTGSLKNTHEKSLQAITILADNSSIPFFVVYYWDDIWAFVVHPVNNIAKTKLKELLKSNHLTEQEYVRFLYDLRGIKLHKEEIELITALNNKKPPIQSLM